MAFSHWRLRVAAVDRRTDGHTRTHTDSNNPRCACVQVRVNKWLDLDDEIGSEVLPLFTLHGDVPQPPIVVELRVEDTHVNFELDTGAAVTKSSFHQLFPEAQLQRSTLGLKTFTGELLQIVGEASVKVSYQDQESRVLPLVVVEGTGPPPLGRNWLQHF